MMEIDIGMLHRGLLGPHFGQRSTDIDDCER